jgi:hypothetical protein
MLPLTLDSNNNPEFEPRMQYPYLGLANLPSSERQPPTCFQWKRVCAGLLILQRTTETFSLQYLQTVNSWRSVVILITRFVGYLIQPSTAANMPSSKGAMSYPSQSGFWTSPFSIFFAPPNMRPSFRKRRKRRQYVSILAISLLFAFKIAQSENLAEHDDFVP